jgi:hypothetical protein
MYHGYISVGGGIVLAAVVEESGLEDGEVVAAIFAHPPVDGEGVSPVLPGHRGEDYIKCRAKNSTGFGHLAGADPAQQGRE